MLITTEIQNLFPGDVLYTEACEDGSPKEGYEETFSIIREALNPPTTKHLSLINARTVLKVPTVARKYVRVVMGTYVIVRRLKGTMVVVDRPDVNGPHDGSESVLAADPFAATPKHGHAGRIQSGHWEPAKNYRPTATLCFCGLSFYGTDTAQADLRFRRHFNEELKKDEYAHQPESFEDTGGVAQRKPFNYATAEFGKLGDYRSAEYSPKIKIYSRRANSEGETRWMEIHPDDLAELQERMEARAAQED